MTGGCARSGGCLAAVPTVLRRDGSAITLGTEGPTPAWQTACNASFAEDNPMAWTTPTLVEICVGLEINGYLPAEF